MLPCLNCYKKFYNRACHEHHIDINVVTNFRYALCFKQVEVSSTPHECYHAKCPSWKEIVDLTKHQCCIQPIGEEDMPKKKKKNIYKIYNIYKKHLEFYKKNLQKFPPNHVVSTYEEHKFIYADFEVAVGELGHHHPILICTQTTEDGDPFFDFYGKDCTERF